MYFWLDFASHMTGFNQPVCSVSEYRDIPTLKFADDQCDQKKNGQMSLKVTRKIMDFDTPMQKMPNNMGDLGKIIVAKGF